jgi:hypothetical protein
MQSVRQSKRRRRCSEKAKDQIGSNALNLFMVIAPGDSCLMLVEAKKIDRTGTELACSFSRT